MAKKIFVCLITILLFLTVSVEAEARKIIVRSVYAPYVFYGTQRKVKTETRTVDGKVVSQTVTTTIIPRPITVTARDYSLIPVCTERNKMCMLGDYKLSAKGSKDSIYADIGIICTSDLGFCTDGYRVISRNIVFKTRKKKR